MHKTKMRNRIMSASDNAMENHVDLFPKCDHIISLSCEEDASVISDERSYPEPRKVRNLSNSK